MDDIQKFDHAFRAAVVETPVSNDRSELWALTRRRRRRELQAKVVGSVAAAFVMVGAFAWVQWAADSDPSKEVTSLAAGTATEAGDISPGRTTPQGVSLDAEPIDATTAALTVDGLQLLASRKEQPIAPFDTFAPPRDGSLTVTGAASFLDDDSSKWLTVISVAAGLGSTVTANVEREELDRTSTSDGVAYLAVTTPTAAGEPVVTVETEPSDGSPVESVTFFPYVRGKDCAANPEVSGAEATVPGQAGPTPPSEGPESTEPRDGPAFVAPLMVPCP